MPSQLSHGESLFPTESLGYGLSSQFSFGCIFCRTGQERLIAHALNTNYGDTLWAVAVSQLKHKSINGIKSVNEHILLPGYILFRAYNEQPPLHNVQAMQGIIKVLRNSSGDWRLSGIDHQFANWVFDQGGLIGLSKAYTEGDKIRIQSGPLKDLEGHLIKIDRRSRNGLVEIHFNARVWKVWLAFEAIEPSSPPSIRDMQKEESFGL